jgi:hypothetical protein
VAVMEKLVDGGEVRAMEPNPTTVKMCFVFLKVPKCEILISWILMILYIMKSL